MSRATGIAALADIPYGPFLVTSVTSAPVSAASCFAAYARTNTGVGLAVVEHPDAQARRANRATGASSEISGRGSESGR